MISRSSVILAMVLCSSLLIAQTPANFSGKWEFDSTKSNAGEGGMFMYSAQILEITQNASSITIVNTMMRHGSEDVKETASYKLDGKEKGVKGDMGTTRTSAKWSKDKTVLTITTVMTVDANGKPEDWLVDDSYKLFDDGKILVSRSFSKNRNGEKTIIQVYNKK